MDVPNKWIRDRCADVWGWTWNYDHNNFFSILINQLMVIMIILFKNSVMLKSKKKSVMVTNVEWMNAGIIFIFYSLTLSNDQEVMCVLFFLFVFLMLTGWLPFNWVITNCWVFSLHSFYSWAALLLSFAPGCKIDCKIDWLIDWLNNFCERREKRA